MEADAIHGASASGLDDLGAAQRSDETHHSVADGRIRKRTKTGCLTCRKRRIKCGEERPTCKNCLKSKRGCEGYNQRVVFKSPIGNWPNPQQPANIVQFHNGGLPGSATSPTFPSGQNVTNPTHMEATMMDMQSSNGRGFPIDVTSHGLPIMPISAGPYPAHPLVSGPGVIQHSVLDHLVSDRAVPGLTHRGKHHLEDTVFPMIAVLSMHLIRSLSPNQQTYIPDSPGRFCIVYHHHIRQKKPRCHMM